MHTLDAHSWTNFVRALGVALMLLGIAPLATAGEKLAKPIPVILDCDVGDDIDDAFALALALRIPELDLRGITTVFGDAHTRALIACRMLDLAKRTDIPVASGSPAKDKPETKGQFDYGARYSGTNRPVKESAVEFMYKRLKKHPGELTILAVGPLTNVGELLTMHPDCKPWIKRIVIMGGSVRVGYNSKPPIEVEWNIKCDSKAAQAVFSSGVPLTVAPLDATAHLKLGADARKRLFAANTALTDQLEALYKLWGQNDPVLYDPVAVMLCFNEQFCKMEDLRIEVDDRGFTRIAEGKANARIATAIDRAAFLAWYVDRVAGKSAKR